MESEAKRVMLDRIRSALLDAPEAAPVVRAYRQRDTRTRAEILAELLDRLRDYKAVVETVTEETLRGAVAAACDTYGIRELALPSDAPEQWLPAEVTPLYDAPPLTNAQLDASDGVLTGCAFAIAQTGTIVLDGGALQGRRALSLAPDRHLCVVRAEQVVGIVPEGIQRLAAHATQPITFISGPSATSDIELSRVEGVHGPRTLHVFLLV